MHLEACTEYQSAQWERILRFQASGRKELAEKGASPDEALIGELLTPGTDQRCGVNVVARPSREVVDCIDVLQHYLRGAEAAQYYYPVGDLHLTVLEICFGCTSDYTRRIANDSLLSIVQNAAAAFASPLLGWPVFVYDRRACALSFVQLDRHLQSIRSGLAEQLRRSGVQLSSRYPAQSAHVTLMRYVAPLRTQLKQWVALLVSAPVQRTLTWSVDSVWLTWGGNWYGMRSRIQEAGPYRLASMAE